MPTVPSVTGGASRPPSPDGLLWIGRTYRRFRCGDPHCARRPSGHCFVHEALWRGISRKVSHHPPWVVPRVTRIFLVHPDRSRSPGQGKIFGYFVLHRVERLGALDAARSSPDLDVLRRPGLGDLGVLEVDVFDAASGRPVPAARVVVTGAAGKVELQLDPDRRHHRFELEPGLWTVEAELPDGEPERIPGVEVIEGTKRSIAIFVGSPVGGAAPVDRPVDPGGSGAGPGEPARPLVDPVVTVPPGPEFLAPHRSCSLRLRPGSVYLVDRLCAEITDRFGKETVASGLAERYRRAAGDREREVLVAEGRRRFDAVAERVAAALDLAPRPVHGGRAERRGDLVLFHDPPLYVRHPKASFRSLEHLDGGHLLDQIEAGERRPLIRTVVPAAKGRCASRRELVARLAEATRVTPALAGRFLDALFGRRGGAEGLIARELRRPGAARLAGWGTLRRGAAVPGPPPARARSQRELVAELSAGLGVSAGLTRRLLRELVALAGRELLERGALRWPGCGTFRRAGGDVRFSPALALAETAPDFTPSSALALA